MPNYKKLKIDLLMVVALVFTGFAVTKTIAHPADNDDEGRIAFVGNQSGSWQLYTMNPDGGHRRQVTHLPSVSWSIWAPDFSPDGKRIAFCYGDVAPSGAFVLEIYAINVDGTGLKQLTHDGLFDCVPRWSPDGSHIVFSKQSLRTGRTVVATMRADGSDVKELTTDLWGSFRCGYTPDGSHIVWETQEAGFISVLRIMNADGTNQERITQAPIKAGQPSAPAADNVVFTNNENTPPAVTNSLFRVNLDGSDVDQLTRPAGNSHDVFPSYSPSKRKIVFASDRLSTDASMDIFTMDADGSHMKRIASGVTVGGCPDTNCVTPTWGRKP